MAMSFGSINIAIAVNRGENHVSRPACGSRRSERGEQPEKPDRNPFLDFLTAPLQAMGKMKGNQNDKEYSKYHHALEAGNALKGF